MANSPGPKDLPETLQRIARIGQQFFHVHTCILYPINPITGAFLEPVGVGPIWEKHKGLLVALRARIEQTVLAEGTLLIEDLKTPDYQGIFAGQADIQSLVATTLPAEPQQKRLAIVYLFFEPGYQLSPGQLEPFYWVSNVASLILRNLWTLHRSHEVERIGYEINKDLGESERQLFLKLRTHVPAILDISHFFSLAIYQPQINNLEMHVLEQGKSEVHHKFTVAGAVKWVLENGEPLVTRQRSKDWEQHKLKTEIIPFPGTQLLEESLIFIPLTIRDVPYGVLSVQQIPSYAYDDDDLHILKLLGNHISLSLSNMRLFKSVSQLTSAGQELTRQLDSQDILQRVVDTIRETASAEPVILYHYSPEAKTLSPEPITSGVFKDPNYSLLNPSREDDIATLTLKRTKPLFARNSARLYRDLGGDVQVRKGQFQQREKVLSTAALPLFVGAEPVGVLFVNFRQKQRFDHPQRLLIEGLAHYAAIAIKNTRLHTDLIHRRSKELESIQEIGSGLSQSLERAQVMRMILHRAVAHTNAEEASIMLYDEASDKLKTVVAIGPSAPQSQGQIIPRDQRTGITYWVLKNKQQVRADDVRTQDPWKNMYIEILSDMHSELDTPLLDKGRAIGVINLESPRTEAFQASDEVFLTILAELAVLALKDTEAYERETRDRQRFELLYQAGQQLGKITDQSQLTQAYDIIVKTAERHFKSTVVIRLFDAAKQELVVERASGFSDPPPFERMSIREGANGYVARTRQRAVYDDTKNPPPGAVSPKLSNPKTRSLVVVPISIANEYYGNLGLGHEHPGYFSQDDIDLIDGLAYELANAIDRLARVQMIQVATKQATEAEFLIQAEASARQVAEQQDKDDSYARAVVEELGKRVQRLEERDKQLREAVMRAQKRYRLTINLSQNRLQGHEWVTPISPTPHRYQAEYPVLFPVEDLVTRADNLSLLVRKGAAGQWRTEAKLIADTLDAALRRDAQISAPLITTPQLTHHAHDFWLQFKGPMPSLRIPFELLRVNNEYMNRQFILTRQLLSDQNSPTDALRSFPLFLEDLLPKQQKLRILLVGVDCAGRTPQAEEEAKQLAAVIEAALKELSIPCDITLLTGVDATYDNVTGELLQGYHLFHYAGDGYFHTQLPEASGLFLYASARGASNVRPLTANDLRTVLAERPLQIAFLSCCLGARSGLHMERGDLYGIVDALVRTGSSTILGYRWEVGDTAARQLAADFYASLLRTFSPGEAALEARKKAATRTRGADDDTWAALVVVTQHQDG